MAQIHLNPGPGKAWPLALLTVAVAAVSAVWWSTASRPPGLDDRPGHGEAAARASAPVASPASPSSSALAKVLRAQLEEAAREVARHPDMAPIAGPVRERPAFVSHLEWLMLKGAAQQSEAPEQELTRLVNSLRFNKQMEYWQGLPRGADAARRQQVAARLLDELPARVSQGEMDLKEAQATQRQLLVDAEPDAQARQARAAAESRRLQAAVPRAHVASAAGP